MTAPIDGSSIFLPEFEGCPPSTPLARLCPVPIAHFHLRTVFLMIELTSVQQTRIQNAYLPEPHSIESETCQLVSVVRGRHGHFPYPYSVIHSYSPLMFVVILCACPPPRNPFPCSPPCSITPLLPRRLFILYFACLVPRVFVYFFAFLNIFPFSWTPILPYFSPVTCASY